MKKGHNDTIFLHTEEKFVILNHLIYNSAVNESDLNLVLGSDTKEICEPLEIKNILITKKELLKLTNGHKSYYLKIQTLRYEF